MIMIIMIILIRIIKKKAFLQKNLLLMDNLDFINNYYKFNDKFFSFSLYSLSFKVRICLT